MDSFKNNNFPPTIGGGAQFGEYPATKKVNAAQTNFTKSNTATQGVNAEFGEYQKTTNEISMDSGNNPLGGDILQATSTGVTLGNFGALTTKITDLNAQHGSSFDNLNSNPSNAFNLGEFQGSSNSTNNLEGLDADILQQTSSAESFTDSNAFTNNMPNTYKDNSQNFDFSAYQGNEFSPENLINSNPLVDNNIPGFDFNKYQVNQKDPDPNQILHQSIEPGFETNSTIETGAFQTDIKTKTGNYQDFDFEEYQKTEVTGDTKSNLKNVQKVENKANGPILDNIPDFGTNEFRINELVDTKAYQPNETTINEDIKDISANEFIDTASYQPTKPKTDTTMQKVDNIAYNPSEPMINYENLDINEFSGNEFIDTASYQASQPVISRPSTIQKIDTIALNPSQPVIKSKPTLQKIDTVEYKKSEPIVDSTVFSTTPNYETISGFDTINYGATSNIKTTTTTTKTTTKKSSPAIDFTAYPTTETISKTSSNLQIGTNNFQEFKPVVETNSTIDTNALTTNSPEFDIDALLGNQPTFDNFDFNTISNYEDTTTYQTSNQEITSSPLVDTTSALKSNPIKDTSNLGTKTQNFDLGYDFSDINITPQISKPAQTTIIKQKALPVKTQTTIINKPTSLPVQTTTTVIKPTPLPNKTTVFNYPTLPVQTQTTVIKSKPLTTQTTVIKSKNLPVQTQTRVIKPTPLPAQTTTTVIKQSPLPIQNTTTVIKTPSFTAPTQTIINTTSIPKVKSPILDTGYTLGNIESSPDLNIDEILKNYQTSTNLQQGRDSTILDEFFSSPQSFNNNIPQTTTIPSITTKVEQVKIPSYTPPIPVTIPEPTVPKTLDTGATFGEYKQSSNIEEIQTTFSPSFDIFNFNQGLPETIPPNQGLPETIPLNLPETIPPNQGLPETIPLNLPETIPPNQGLPETIPLNLPETIPPNLPETIPLNLPETIPPNQGLPETIPPNTKTIITTIPKVQQQAINPEKIYIPPQNNIQVPQTLTYEQKSYVPSPQLVEIPKRVSFSVPKKIGYVQKSFVPPPQLVGIPKITNVISPQTVQYSQKSYVPPPQFVETTKRTSFSVPKTVAYAQNSFVPQPQIVRTQITTPISVQNAIPYEQKSFVPSPNIRRVLKLFLMHKNHLFLLQLL